VAAELTSALTVPKRAIASAIKALAILCVGDVGLHVEAVGTERPHLGRLPPRRAPRAGR